MKSPPGLNSMKWGNAIALSSLSCRLQAYKNVLALVSPSKTALKINKSVTVIIPMSYAISDPYLSRVSHFGSFEARSTRCLKQLIIAHRIGAILYTNHPFENGAETEEELASKWNEIQHVLDGAELKEFGDSTSLEMRSIVSSAYVVNDPELSSSSAVEVSEVASWRAVSGTIHSPGPGAAAVQLQTWLDFACGGWPNSFG